MEILGTSLRVCVDDLDAAIPVYEKLANAEAARFQSGPVSVAAVGPFFLMSGPQEHLDILRKISATLAVKDVDDAVTDLRTVGADIIAGPKPTPAGRNLIARHPDGSVFEYVDRQGAAGA
ncbi:VOC family protein [Streptomyces armeniacus]|uniref:VOC family protein n=1 Tax=Streptomyces armeniacus TaxID=83291 RepID=A0A345XID3_9ACTN|nr:VOC family protein [Streptomyces armeniacus]AXK31399.1 VOC family protein [Streptomyces armeniacus]